MKRAGTSLVRYPNCFLNVIYGNIKIRAVKIRSFPFSESDEIIWINWLILTTNPNILFKNDSLRSR